MGIVYLFEQAEDRREPRASEPRDQDAMARILELPIDSRVARGVPPRTIYKQVECLLTLSGMDLSCDKTRADFKIVTYLIQGMMDRVDGVINSDRCLMLDTLRLALAYEEPVDDTPELFKDLLGRLD